MCLCDITPTTSSSSGPGDNARFSLCVCLLAFPRVFSVDINSNAERKFISWLKSNAVRRMTTADITKMGATRKCMTHNYVQREKVGTFTWAKMATEHERQVVCTKVTEVCFILAAQWRPWCHHKITHQIWAQTIIFNDNMSGKNRQGVPELSIILQCVLDICFVFLFPATVLKLNIRTKDTTLSVNCPRPKTLKITIERKTQRWA